MLDDKFNIVRAEIGRESKTRNESIDQLNQCLEVLFNKIIILNTIFMGFNKECLFNIYGNKKLAIKSLTVLHS